jgi:hypothetical protein
MKSQIYKLVSSKKLGKKDIIQGVIWLWEFHLNAISLPIAAAIGKIVFGMIIGMPIGVLIGLIIGNHKDKIARNENRVL